MANTRKRKTTTVKKEATLNKAIKKKTTKKPNNSSSVEIPTTTNSKMLQKSLSTLVHEPTWIKHLQNLFNTDNFKRIEEHLNNQWSDGKITYPPNDLIFEAFNKTPFDKVKVVLLGQDPYHDNGQVGIKIILKKKKKPFVIFLGSWLSIFCT